MTSLATLTSLAMLKVRREHEGTDYLDYLVPFVAYVISKTSSVPFTSAAVQHQLRTEFGLSIPRRPVDLVLSRLVKRGVLARDYGSFTIIGNLPNDGFELRRAEARRRQQIVITRLVRFAQENGATWTDDQAVDAFIRYLSRYSIHCLKAYASGSALPEVPKQGAAVTYLVNAFVANAHATSTELFDDIMVFVESQMLSNALICRDLQANARRFSDITFFLDTPLIIGLLGLDGPEREALGIELLQLIRNLKGKLAVFDHTLDELDQVLAGSIQRFAAPTFRSRIVLQCRRTGQTATDLEIVRASIDERLRTLSISIERTPKNLLQFQIDEQVLEEAISEEIDYFTSRALQYDVKSIRSIYTLREGTHPKSLERAKAVLVTSNTALARVAYHFGREHESSREVSTVVTEMSVAAIAWLKAPMGAPDLPRLEVLSACYAAMKPTRQVFEKFIGEIDRLKQNGRITVGQHELLRCSVNAHDELMRLTMGDDSRFSGRTVTEILETVEEQISAKERAKFDLERAQLRQEATALKDDATSHRSDLERERQEHERTRRQVERLRVREMDRIKATYWAALKSARLIRITSFALLLGLAVGGLLTPLIGHQTGVIRQILSGVAILTAIWDCARRIWGANASSLSERLEAATSMWLFRVLLRIRGLEDVDAAKAIQHLRASSITLNGATTSTEVDSSAA